MDVHESNKGFHKGFQLREKGSMVFENMLEGLNEF